MCRFFLVVLLIIILNGCGPGGDDSAASNSSNNTNIPSVPVEQSITPEQLVLTGQSVTAEQSVSSEAIVFTEQLITPERSVSTKAIVFTEQLITPEQSVPTEAIVFTEQLIIPEQSVTTEQPVFAEQSVPKKSLVFIEPSSDLEVFSYETQRIVKLSLFISNEYTSSQKQILLYETKKTISDVDAPGDIVTYEALLTEGVSSNNGRYDTALTLGAHIESIWIIIPAISYEKRIQIINDEIILYIVKGS